MHKLSWVIRKVRSRPLGTLVEMSSLSGAAKQNQKIHSILLSIKKLKPCEQLKCKILCWNVWSIVNSVKLHKFLDYLDDNGIDICCITETWFSTLKGVHTKSIRDAGYHIIHCVRDQIRGRGTTIVYKNDTKSFSGQASATKYFSFEYSYKSFSYKNRS